MLEGILRHSTHCLRVGTNARPRTLEPARGLGGGFSMRRKLHRMMRRMCYAPMKTISKPYAPPDENISKHQGAQDIVG